MTSQMLDLHFTRKYIYVMTSGVHHPLYIPTSWQRELRPILGRAEDYKKAFIDKRDPQRYLIFRTGVGWALQPQTEPPPWRQICFPTLRYFPLPGTRSGIVNIGDFSFAHWERSSEEISHFLSILSIIIAFLWQIRLSNKFSTASNTYIFLCDVNFEDLTIKSRRFNRKVLKYALKLNLGLGTWTLWIWSDLYEKSKFIVILDRNNQIKVYGTHKHASSTIGLRNIIEYTKL